MIHVTRFHGEPIVINADLIELIEATPDTVITLITGRKIMVKEPVEEVVDRVIAYEQNVRIFGSAIKKHCRVMEDEKTEGNS
jgi:flagellar protein FlbD